VSIDALTDPGAHFHFRRAKGRFAIRRSYPGVRLISRGDAVRVDHIGLDAVRRQPTGQPETLAASFEGDAIRLMVRPIFWPPRSGDAAVACNPASLGSSFFAGACRYLEQCRQRASSTGPSRSPRLTCYPRRERRRSAEVIWLRHGAPRRLYPATMMLCPRRSPVASLSAGLTRSRCGSPAE